MTDPFGVKGNSTPPAGMAKFYVIFHSAPKPHPAFSKYSGVWTPVHGMVRIKATTEYFADEPDCRSAQKTYPNHSRST